MTAGDLLDRICEQSFGVPWVRYEGCGSIAIELAGGFTGSTSVYDAATEELVGIDSFGDTPSPPCQSFRVIAGSPFECETATRCELCGWDYDESIPPCE